MCAVTEGFVYKANTCTHTHTHTNSTHNSTIYNTTTCFGSISPPVGECNRIS